jgi:glycosyltransferase involved in cell wall biosynthesis
LKVAINNYPMRSGHKDRGVGVYTKNLIDSLKKAGIEVIEFENLEDVTGVDLIHYTWFDLYFKTLKISKEYPTVVTIHDVMPLIFQDHFPVGIRGKVNLFFQKQALKNVKKIITVSEISKRDIIKCLELDPAKISITKESIDPKFRVLPKKDLEKIKEKYNLPEKFILYVGDGNFVKNLPFLIKGFKSIEVNDIKLVLVGKVFLKTSAELNHPELKSLKETLELIKKSGLTDKVILPGYVPTEDLVAFYNLATVYVQPSLYEGFGIPILEAMSCGTPVVSSTGGSLKEVGGEAASYFDPNDLDQFIKNLTAVLQNGTLQDKLSKKGSERAKLFSWQEVTNETIKVYQETINH